MSTESNAVVSSESSGLRRRALRLEYATIAWTVLEGLAAIAAGWLAGSVALVAFGLDSSVEVFASAVVVWELRGVDRGREGRALKAIGVAYLVVAAYILVDAGNALRIANRPEGSPVGMVLLSSTVVVMAVLGFAKLRVGRRLGSATVVADGRFSLVDGSLAGAVLVGLVATALLGWWWADALLAIGIALFAFREGREAWLGDEPAPSGAGQTTLAHGDD
jgi:divalent metal cation (Fe/Co/Zn/Cd) transporter